MNSMGNLFLVIEDEDNELNLYNYGKNTAFLINDEGKDWLKIGLNSRSENGDLHRLYDPRGINLYNAGFEGLKIIDENQTFKGTINYMDYRKKEIFRSVQTDIYGKSPFYLMDSTTGTLRITSPSVSFEYSANLFSGLTLGTRLNYIAQHGLKNLGAKPELTNRYISGQVGLAYALTDNIYIGAKIDPFYNFEKIDFVKDAETGTWPTTYRYRGFNIFRPMVDEFSRYNKNYGFNSDLQLAYSGKDSLFRAFLSAGYFFQDLFCDDGVEEKHKEGYWQQDGYYFDFAARYVPDFLSKSALVGFNIKWSNLNSWAEHPQLPIIFQETKQNIFSFGAGISYFFEDLKLRCGLEYHHTNLDTTLNDYLGKEAFSDNLPQNTINAGLEHHTFENIFIRLGYIYNTRDNRRKDFINSLNPAQIDVKRNTFTFGLSYNIPNFVRFDFLGLYGKHTSDELKDLKYSEFSAVVYAKFYVF